MTIKTVRFYKYSLSLRQPLKLKENLLSVREGLLISLSDPYGNIGWGEIAPLPGFSRETLGSVTRQLPRAAEFMRQAEIPDDVELLTGAFDTWLDPLTQTASLRFGIESAVLSLLSNAKHVSFAELIAGNQASRIEINALLAGSQPDVLARIDDLMKHGYSTFKLKVGTRPLEDEIALIAAVRRRIGPQNNLRLDANRQYDIETTHQLFRGIESLDIEYIEEPVRNLNQLRVVLKDKRRKVPVALDESLLELRPHDLALPFGISAVVLKPTLLGLEKSMAFARVAVENNILPVVSSSFESSLGLSILAVLACSIGGAQRAVAGLDTLSWLAEDTVDTPLMLTGNHIDLQTLVDIQKHVRISILEEVSVDDN